MAKYEEALDTVTWYNGLAETVFRWRDIKPSKFSNSPYIFPRHDYGIDVFIGSDMDRAQLQMIWMIAVSLFGSYGTSPRYGWITDIDGFRQWVLDITATWRESEDYNGPEEYRISYEEETHG